MTRLHYKLLGHVGGSHGRVHTTYSEDPGLTLAWGIPLSLTLFPICLLSNKGKKTWKLSTFFVENNTKV